MLNFLFQYDSSIWPILLADFEDATSNYAIINVRKSCLPLGFIALISLILSIFVEVFGSTS